MRFLLIARVVLFLLAAHICPVSTRAANHESPEALRAKLRARVHNYSLSAGNFVDALTRAAGEFQIPMGVAWVDTPEARAKLTLAWKSATVREVIEAIARTQPGYQVKIRNGTVHVFTPKLISNDQNFLRITVKSFVVHEEVTEVASRKLRDLVKLTVSPPKPQPGTAGGILTSSFANSDDPKISVQLDNASVQDVLDALAVASARKIWIVTFSGESALTPTGFRKTLTLWNTFPIPDTEQPLWDFLHWGDPIPVTVRGNK